MAFVDSLEDGLGVRMQAIGLSETGIAMRSLTGMASRSLNRGLCVLSAETSNPSRLVCGLTHSCKQASVFGAAR